MNTDIQNILNIVQESEHPLVVVRSILPEEYALFVALLSFMQVDNGKNITILSDSPVQGWFKLIAAHYGIDIDESTEPLRHIIEVPTSDGAMSSVSYDMNDGKFSLYITPGNAKFDFSKVSFKTTGAQHDVLITVGFNSSDEINAFLGEAKSSIMNSQHVVMGIANSDDVFESGIQNTHYVDTKLETIVRMVLGLAKGKLTDQAKELAASLLLKVNPAVTNERIFLADVYRVLSELFKAGANVENIFKVIFQKKPEYAALYKKIADKTKVNVANKTATAYVSKNEISQIGLDSTDLLISFSDLVKNLQVACASLLIEENDNNVIAYVSGKPEKVLAIAEKLKLTVIENAAAGVVNGDLAKKVLEQAGLESNDVPNMPDSGTGSNTAEVSTKPEIKIQKEEDRNQSTKKYFDKVPAAPMQEEIRSEPIVQASGMQTKPAMNVVPEQNADVIIPNPKMFGEAEMEDEDFDEPNEIVISQEVEQPTMQIEDVAVSNMPATVETTKNAAINANTYQPIQNPGFVQKSPSIPSVTNPNSQISNQQPHQGPIGRNVNFGDIANRMKTK